MSLFNKLSRMLRNHPQTSADEKFIEEARRNQRTHERFALDRTEFARCNFDAPSGRQSAAVKDISYGGMGVILASNQDILPTRMHVQLQILDHSIEVDVSKAHEARDPARGRSFIGFSMHHESVDTLVFLRDIIESIRVGKTLVALDATHLKEPYNKPNWLCYRGEGPTDIRLRVGNNARILEEGQITFRSGSYYHEVIFEAGKAIRTGSSLSDFGPSSRMEYSPQPLPKVARLLAYLLTGAQPKELLEACQPIVDQCFEVLGLSASRKAS